MVRNWQNKKGEIAWEYIAGAIIALIILTIILVFTTSVKDRVIEYLGSIATDIFGW